MDGQSLGIAPTKPTERYAKPSKPTERYAKPTERYAKFKAALEKTNRR